MTVTESKNMASGGSQNQSGRRGETNKYSLHRKSHNPAPQKIQYHLRIFFTYKAFTILVAYSL